MVVTVLRVTRRDHTSPTAPVGLVKTGAIHRHFRTQLLTTKDR